MGILVVLGVVCYGKMVPGGSSGRICECPPLVKIRASRLFVVCVPCLAFSSALF